MVVVLLFILAEIALVLAGVIFVYGGLKKDSRLMDIKNLPSIYQFLKEQYEGIFLRTLYVLLGVFLLSQAMYVAILFLQ